MNILNDTKFVVNCISELGYLREKIAACTVRPRFQWISLKGYGHFGAKTLSDLRVELVSSEIKLWLIQIMQTSKIINKIFP